MSHARLLLFIVINLWDVHATKYCSYELNGDPKYFVCARNEYCCNLGCCVHLAFQFYQLWYYWLLLIFMFMICSGGSWWYKFCRRTESASHYPSMPLAIERTSRHNMPEVRGRRAAARVLERASANEPASYHFHRIWKANNLATAPNYYSNSVVRYHNSDVENRRQHHECPYYQLYGPPPSYESVVRLSENAIGGHTSCMLLPAGESSPAPVYSAASPPPLAFQSQFESPQEKQTSSETTYQVEVFPNKKQERYSMPELFALPQPLAASSPDEFSPTEEPLFLSAPVKTSQRLRYTSCTTNVSPQSATADTPACFAAKDQPHCHRKHHESHSLLHQPVIHDGGLAHNILGAAGQSSPPDSTSCPHGRPTYPGPSSSLSLPSSSSANPAQVPPSSLLPVATSAPASTTANEENDTGV